MYMEEEGTTDTENVYGLEEIPEQDSIQENSENKNQSSPQTPHFVGNQHGGVAAYNQRQKNMQNSYMKADNQYERNQIDTVFDSTAEMSKSIVREMFHFSSQSIDGMCAAILHITQSKEIQSYYQRRKHRFDKNNDKETRQIKCSDDIDVKNNHERDKLLQIYMNKSLISNTYNEMHMLNNSLMPSSIHHQPHDINNRLNLSRETTPKHPNIKNYQIDDSFRQNQQNQSNNNLSIKGRQIGENTSRFKRLSSFSVNESRVNTEIANYVKQYFDLQKSNKRKTKAQVLLNIVSRSVKSVIAAVSLWVPTLYKVISKQQDPVQYVYSNVVEKFLGEDGMLSSINQYMLTGGQSQQKGTKHNQNSQIQKAILSEIIITPDQVTTGFLEDTQLIIQLSIDQFFLTMKVLVKKGIRVFSHTQSLGDIRKADDRKFFRKISRITKNTFIAIFSFSFQKTFMSLPLIPKYIKVQTEDGYLVNMNRICNKQSYNAVYFQHGVLDNALTWVVHGPSDSIAYQAHESGFDVFMGNFRGVYPRKIASWKDPNTYWDYSLDELANYDIQAFIKKIRETKIQELKETYKKITKLSDEDIIKDIESKLTITYVGHSLGGMTLLMYIINQRIKRQPHYLTNAILLSPAGIHTNAPAEIGISGWIFTHILSKFMSHVAIPRGVVSLLQKVHRDVRGLPAASDLITYLSSHTLGGYKTGESPVWKSAQIIKSFFQFGFSSDLGKHFYTNWKTDKFQAFDYGRKKNIAVYGTEKPLNYLDHYHLIDIPIYFFISMNDTLIRADDIVEHYHTLKKHHRSLAHMKLFEGFSHVDFTYQSHHIMINEILQTMKKCKKQHDRQVMRHKVHPFDNDQYQQDQQQTFMEKQEVLKQENDDAYFLSVDQQQSSMPRKQESEDDHQDNSIAKKQPHKSHNLVKKEQFINKTNSKVYDISNSNCSSCDQHNEKFAKSMRRIKTMQDVRQVQDGYEEENEDLSNDNTNQILNDSLEIQQL
eukprot:403354949